MNGVVEDLVNDPVAIAPGSDFVQPPAAISSLSEFESLRQAWPKMQRRTDLYSSSSFPLTRLFRTVGLGGAGLAPGIGGADTARVPTSGRKLPLRS